MLAIVNWRKTFLKNTPWNSEHGCGSAQNREKNGMAALARLARVFLEGGFATPKKCLPTNDLGDRYKRHLVRLGYPRSGAIATTAIPN